MKFFFHLFQLSALTLMYAKADNTPDLCTSDIDNLEIIKPSDTVTDGHAIPSITVGGETYSGDEPHFVVNPGGRHKKIIVYIPGTTDRPSLSSCLIKSMSETLSFPVLALSYQYLSSGDKFRNGKCALMSGQVGLDEQINCLDQQHVDAIDGGDYGATHYKDDGSAFWGEVLPENSLTRRLGDLLIHLDQKHPEESWSTFLQLDMKTPVWERIIFSGHSQGAGHVAYLAQTKNINGAVMISGPQDECIGCPEGTTFWIDESYVSSSDTPYTALAQGMEPLLPVMEDNWKRMKTANPDINWATTAPQSTGFGLETTSGDAYASPLFTNVTYADRSTCGGKEHCSVAIDDSVPYIQMVDGETFYLYEATVWPSIMEAASEKSIYPKPCIDSSLSFQMWGGLRDCDWVKKTKTELKCSAKNLGKADTACRETCGTCGTCTDTVAKFELKNRNTPTGKLIVRCAWVKKSSTTRCMINGVKEMCPETCGEC